ncbi:MAG: hypothetical protein KatS3mg104_0574 [Phycisphaerae bacterium]|jgi:diguanylate cyclase (GGDEF)-like protein|nr:MAG: hypothetical protein KatS3mg104_0574 [Phycisphaerae bacterium]
MIFDCLRFERGLLNGRGRFSRRVLLTGGLFLVFLATAWIASTLMHAAQTSLASAITTLLILMSIKVLMLISALSYEMLYWRRPMQELVEQVKQTRQGQRSPEDWKNLKHGVREISEQIVALIRENQMLKSEVAELKSEMRQRIASRTDALERQLGVARAKASKDALTGVFNRRHFEETFPKLVELSRTQGENLVIMMVDVDYFKNLNDTLGHATGDELLRSIGQILRSSVRETDMVYRYGGDEFIVLLMGSDITSAKILSDRLKHLVDGLTLHHRFLSPRPRLSIGLASLKEDLSPVANPSELLKIADQKLYEIKHARPVPSRRSA